MRQGTLRRQPPQRVRRRDRAASAPCEFAARPADRRPRAAPQGRPLPLRPRRRGPPRARLLRGLQHPGLRARAAAARHRRRRPGSRRSSSASAAASTPPTRSSSRPRRWTGSAGPAPTSSASRCPASRRATGTKSNAIHLMESLGITWEELDIRPAATQMLDATSGHPFGRGEEVYDVTFENVQAGLRTDYLFRVANQRGGIVLGTGDLSELALGWCTYGVGDQMSHYGVNSRRAEDVDAAPDPLGRLVAPVRGRGQRHADSNPRPGDQPRARPGQGGREDPVAPRTRSAPTPCRTSRSSTCCAAATARARSPSSPGTPGATPRRGSGRRATPRAARTAYDLATIRHWMEVFVQRFFANQFKRSALPNGPKVVAGRLAVAARRLAYAVRRRLARAGSPSSTPTSRRPDTSTSCDVHAVLRALVGEQGVAHPVEPLARPVQRLAQGVDLAPHPDPLHQAPRRLVVREAVGGDPPQPELVEAQPQQLAHGLGGVAVAACGRGGAPSRARPAPPRACSLTSAWAQASPTLTIRSPMTAPSSSTTRTWRAGRGPRTWRGTPRSSRGRR